MNLFFLTLAALVANVSHLSHVPVERMTQLRFIVLPHYGVIWWLDEGGFDNCPLDIFYVQTQLEMMNLETHTP